LCPLAGRLESHPPHETLRTLAIDAQRDGHLAAAVKGCLHVLRVDPLHQRQVLGRFAGRHAVPRAARQADQFALPDSLRRWVEAESHATQTPADLAGLLALAVCAATIARRVEVKPRPGWKEPVNLFVAVLLDPANRKSTVFTDATRPLKEVESELIEGARGDVAREQSERRQAEQRLKAKEKKRPRRMTPQHSRRQVTLRKSWPGGTHDKAGGNSPSPKLNTTASEGSPGRTTLIRLCVNSSDGDTSTCSPQTRPVPVVLPPLHTP